MITKYTVKSASDEVLYEGNDKLAAWAELNADVRDGRSATKVTSDGEFWWNFRKNEWVPVEGKEPVLAPEGW